MKSEKPNKLYIARAGAAAAALALLLLFIIIPGLGVKFGDSDKNPDGEQPISVVVNSTGNKDGVKKDGDSPQPEYLGICPLCYEGIYSPDVYVECRNCFEFTLVSGKEFKCDSCGTGLSIESYSNNDKWIYHSFADCESLVWYPWFVSYNSRDGQNTDVSANLITTVNIKGEFDVDGEFHTSPWYTYKSLPSSLTANFKGEYTVIIYNDKEERLAFARFDAEDKSRIINVEGFSSPIGGTIPVEIILRFNEEAAKIVIMKDGQEIYSRDVSKNTPEVAFTGLDGYKDVVSQMTVTWEAYDADGDELYFELWYCVSDSEYYLLASDIKEMFFEADLTAYPGRDGAYFYIYVTDGVRTAEAYSPKINVEYSPPQILTEQVEIPKVKITEEIYFPAKIYDAQDGWLSGSSVRWILNGEEVSITSVLQTWPYQLEPGLHTFTCIATNSAGLSAQKDFTFEIIDDESDLPDDWSRPEIVHALKEGYIVPLDRIEAPVTRGQFADLMFMLYYNMYPDGLPYYNKNLVTDCGDDNYSEFMMAYLGIMEAPGGLFNPSKSLTERDALRIMYQAWMLASNPGMVLRDINYDEKEALDMFTKNGIFDNSQNIFKPDEKLSKKSALVWVSRMDKWVSPDE